MPFVHKSIRETNNIIRIHNEYSMTIHNCFSRFATTRLGALVREAHQLSLWLHALIACRFDASVWRVGISACVVVHADAHVLLLSFYEAGGNHPMLLRKQIYAYAHVIVYVQLNFMHKHVCAYAYVYAYVYGYAYVSPQPPTKITNQATVNI